MLQTRADHFTIRQDKSNPEVESSEILVKKFKTHIHEENKTFVSESGNNKHLTTHLSFCWHEFIIFDTIQNKIRNDFHYYNNYPN